MSRNDRKFPRNGGFGRHPRPALQQTPIPNVQDMHVAIVRRSPQVSLSMDVYADGLVYGLRQVRPDWQITELTPPGQISKSKSLLGGVQKYYDRYWRYPALVKQQPVDLVHIIDHSDAHIAYWLKNSGKPIVVTCHDLINFFQPENVASQALFPSFSLSAWKYAVKGAVHADRIITVSEHTANDVVKILRRPRETLTVVPNAVDAAFVPMPAAIAAFRQQQQIAPETFCLLNVGSNQPRKNVLTVLLVLWFLKAQGLPVHLWKAGADFNAEQKQIIHNHNLQSHVTYVGKPDQSTLIQLYNAADLLLSPSLYEGFGITILEAMACGTPVITSNSTSLPEVAGDAAVLVEPTDVAAIAAAVEQIYRDANHRQSLIDRGLARAQGFTWEKTAERVAGVYQAAIDPAQRPAIVAHPV